MEKFYTAESISLAMGKHRTTVSRRADKEKWPIAFRKTQGGKNGMANIYITSSLPEDVRFSLMVHEGEAGQDEDRTHALARLDGMLIDENGKPKQSPTISGDQKRTALVKADLVRLYISKVNDSPWGAKDKAKADFITLYNLREWPSLYNTLGEISLRTVERWKKTMGETGGAFALADMRGSHTRGKRSLMAEQAIILERLALNPNRPKISYVVNIAELIMAKRGINHHSSATYRRYLSEYKAKNYDIWVFAREGKKGLDDKVAYNLKRDYDKINVGDVLVADGHTLNFEILNPFTGKPKRMTLLLFFDMKSSYPLGWEIMPTENTAAISAALRRAIIALGKYPDCVYLDNGRAFKSRFFTNSPDFDQAGLSGLYGRLGMLTTFAWAYHGQSKTVERFFGTFYEAEVWMPTYVGNSIDAKPPQMNRGEKLHVALWEKATSGLVVTMEQAHQMIAAFFDEYGQREQGPDSHLAGQRPVDLFMAGRGMGVDREELRELMMETEIKRIGQDGIKLAGEEYYHPALYGRRHPVKVKYDLVDRSSILVYEESGAFMCEALPRPGVHPMAKLGTKADQNLLAEQIELKKTLESKTIGPARELLKNDIMPEYMRWIESMGITPIGSAPSKRGKVKKQEMSPAEIRRIQTDYEKRLRGQEELNRQNEAELGEVYIPTAVNAAAMLWNEVERLNDEQRYEKLVELHIKGTLIPRKWQAWMDYFEQTPSCKKQLDYWKEYKEKMAMVWQVESSMN